MAKKKVAATNLKMLLKCWISNIKILPSPVCSTDAKASHLAWQGSVSIAAIVSIKSCWVVVLRVSGSIPVPVAVPVVGFWVSIVQVSGLWRGRKLWLRSVWRFATAVTTGDGTETLSTEKCKCKYCTSKISLQSLRPATSISPFLFSFSLLNNEDCPRFPADVSVGLN